MKWKLFLAGFMTLAHIVPSSVGAAPQPDERWLRFGLYVMAQDLDRSKAFYSMVFGKPPTMINERIVAFDVAGGLFVVFTEAARDHATIRGDSAVPYIRVADAGAEFERLKAGSVKLMSAVITEPPLQLFRFADPDGNVIEFFSLANR